jgi:hypothetical protein
VGHLPVGDDLQQLLEIGEVVEDQPLGDAGPFGHACGGGSGVAPPDQLERGIGDGGPAALGPGAAALGRTRGRVRHGDQSARWPPSRGRVSRVS